MAIRACILTHRERATSSLVSSLRRLVWSYVLPAANHHPASFSVPQKEDKQTSPGSQPPQKLEQSRACFHLPSVLLGRPVFFFSAFSSCSCPASLTRCSSYTLLSPTPSTPTCRPSYATSQHDRGPSTCQVSWVCSWGNRSSFLASKGHRWFWALHYSAIAPFACLPALVLVRDTAESISI